VGSLARLPPRGHYLAHEVGALAGVSGDQVGQWARRGYIKSSQSTGNPRVYSYQDVAEAMVVHELRQHDVELRVIKRAIEALREIYGDWPLTHANLGIPADRADALYVFEGDAFYDAAKALHGVLKVETVKRIALDLNRGGWAVRELPDLQHIEVNPDRLSGRPTIRGLRVPADLVGEMAKTPGGRTVLRKDYELSPAQIRDAARWWQTVQTFEAAV
jgi:uncharacterized protein (DUF433 family)